MFSFLVLRSIFVCGTPSDFLDICLSLLFKFTFFHIFVSQWVSICSTLLLQHALPVIHLKPPAPIHQELSKMFFLASSSLLDDIHHLVENSPGFFLSVLNIIFSSNTIPSCLISSAFFLQLPKLETEIICTPTKSSKQIT